MQKPYKITTLKNGLRIVTVPMPQAETVTVMTLAGVGSHYEPKEIGGISHFLEHMCFKGTQNRTYTEIASELDGLGAESNAFTNSELTGYFAKAHHRHIDTIIDIISDISINSTFPEAELKKERGVIVEELRMYEDMPQRKIYEVFTELLYGNQPAGRPIIGTMESLKNINQKKMSEYHKKYYVASNVVVVVAGKIESASIVKKITRAFKDIPTTKSSPMPKIVEKQNKPALKIQKKKTDQTHMALGCRSFGRHDKRGVTADLMATILAKGFSSRLFKEMRDERGMCYYVRAMNSTETDVGVFLVTAGVNSSRIEEAVFVVMSQLKRLKDEPVSLKELQKAKEYSIGHLTLAHESSDAFADLYGMQVLFKDTPVKTLQEEIASIRKVTAEDIQKLAQEIFVDKNLNFAVIGNVKETVSLKKALKF
jgi:predicted Zn-dependent peptidase